MTTLPRNQYGLLAEIERAQGIYVNNPRITRSAARIMALLAVKGFVKRSWDEARQCYIYDTTYAGRAALASAVAAAPEPTTTDERP